MTFDEIADKANDEYENEANLEYEQAKKDLSYLLSVLYFQKENIAKAKESIKKAEKEKNTRLRNSEIKRAQEELEWYYPKIKETKEEIKKLINNKINELQNLLNQVLEDD